MPDTKAKLLIVDDELGIRASLADIFIEVGYSVQTAHDRFSALVELRREKPDLILSDLNMPGMSGFEFLSVVRWRFPAIPVIAMSGSFSGDRIPPGVAADAFYEKGSKPGVLARLVDAVSHSEPKAQRWAEGLLAPVWILRSGREKGGAPYVMVTCTECLRTFPEVLRDGAEVIRATDCLRCASLTRYAIVHFAEAVVPEVFHRNPAGALRRGACRTAATKAAS